MFKEIFDLFRKENQLAQAFERSREMLSEDREMFVAASSSLRQKDDARLEIDIYAKDQLINAYEREVRRKVLTHLSVGDQPDLHAALVLSSIVIDIERIGDYTKNIVELALHHPRRLHCGPFEVEIAKIETTVKTMFELLIDALPEADEPKAREVMSEHWWIARKSDEIVNKMIDAEEDLLPSREAVTTAMYARFLKRISAHLKNIASSIVNPFESIGFRGESAPRK